MLLKTSRGLLIMTVLAEDFSRNFHYERFCCTNCWLSTMAVLVEDYFLLLTEVVRIEDYTRTFDYDRSCWRLLEDFDYDCSCWRLLRDFWLRLFLFKTTRGLLIITVLVEDWSLTFDYDRSLLKMIEGFWQWTFLLKAKKALQMLFILFNESTIKLLEMAVPIVGSS